MEQQHSIAATELAAVKRAALSSSASSPELASLASLLPRDDTTDAAFTTTPAPSAVSASSLSSLLSFVVGELVDIDSSGSSTRPSSSPRALVYNFLILPYFLERLLGTGSLVCTDCFLYLFTVLPFRIAALLVRCLLSPLSLFSPSRSRLSVRAVLSSSSSPSGVVADVLRFVLLFLSWYCLSLLPMSRLYHYIRGQSVLKLYVLFNMLQISDRLFASIGEDILDALFSSLHLPLPYLTFHLVISAVYTSLHALLLFAQVITLNVSVNSDNSSLFILLVSNNFVELKSAVFKRFDANNLFQIACSDVVERFQLILFLLLITVMNVSHLGVEVAWEAGWLQKAAVMSVMVVGGEMVVDWIKHGFICKFNMISPRVYRQYADIIQHDFVQAHFAQTAAPHAPPLAASTAPSADSSTSSSTAGTGKSSSAHSVSRRLGLSSLPLAVLVLRVVGSTFQHSSAASSPSIAVSWLPFDLSVEAVLKVSVITLLLAVLTVVKLLISISLLGKIAKQALRDKQQQQHDTRRREEQSQEPDRPKERPSGTADTETKRETGEESDANTWIKDESMEGSADVAVKDESISSTMSRVKKEEDEDGREAKRSGVKRDGLTINTQLVYPARIATPPMPPLEQTSRDSLAPSHSSHPSVTVTAPSDDGSHSQHNQQQPHSLLLPHDSADLSLFASPCVSPSSSSSSASLCLPVAHDGDLVPIHDRVGSVDLLAPSPELYSQLVGIDRYQITVRANIPT